MATKKPKTVLYRRRMEGKTNYSKRLKTLLSKKPRLVVRYTNKKIIAQIINFASEGDKVLVAVDSQALKKYGWNYSYKNTPAAYLTGLLLGKIALEKDCKEAILDTGFKYLLKKGNITALLKGAIDSGMLIPYGGEDIFPDEEIISGKHIKDYAEKLKENKELYEKKFSGYLKNNLSVEKISEDFITVKKKIMG